MKKTYLTPAAEVIRMEQTLLQAVSGFGKSTTTVGDNNAVLGRDFDFEDEE